MHYSASLIRKRQFGMVLMAATIGALIAMAVSLLPASGNSLPKPSNVEVEVVTSGMKVTWDAPDTSGATLPGQLLSYKIERQESLSGDWETWTANTNGTLRRVTDTSGGVSGRFEAGIAYFYRISAIYSDGSDGTVTSDPSHHGVRVAPSYPMPSDPERDGTDDGVELSWTAPDLTDLQDIPSLTGYWVRGYTVTSSTSYTLGSTTTSHTHPDGDFKHNYEMIAIYGVFESRELRFPQGEPPSVPKPTGLDGAAKSQGLEITWDAPDTSDMSVDADLIGYEIQRRRGSPEYTTLVHNTTQTTRSYLDNDPGSGVSFVAGQAYTYRVRAIYRDDDHYVYRSDPSSAKSVWVPNYLAPGDFSVDLSGDEIELDWDAPSISWNANRHGLTGYKLTIVTPSDEASSVTFDRNTTSYSFEASETGPYIFQLYAQYHVFSSRSTQTSIANGGQ